MATPPAPRPRLVPPGTRAVFFDAVGTLIHPDPPAPSVYAEAARRFGSRLDLPAVAARFRAAFRRQEELDHAGGLRTDEAREVARWRAIVAEAGIVLERLLRPVGPQQHPAARRDSSRIPFVAISCRESRRLQ